MIETIRVAVLGVEHRHAIRSLEGLLAAGFDCAGWWTGGEPATAGEFARRFPQVPRMPDRRRLLDDPAVRLVLIADVPDRRAGLAMEAMQAGKDVLVDKPGCTTRADLAKLEDVAAATGRIWAIDFTERHELASVEAAIRLVTDGAIGAVVNVIALGPHRLNATLRPDWFFDPVRSGGILCDLASHQIDQFLAFTGADAVDVVAASAGNLATPDRPGFQDHGDILLQAGSARGYIRVDWLTPAALPVWGDCRTLVAGTKGTIELRKYIDIGGRPGGDHILVVDGKQAGSVVPSGPGVDFYGRLRDDVLMRGDTAQSRGHAVRVTRIALQAQRLADRKARPG